MTTLREVFSFPNPVNEIAARAVAAGAAIMAAVTIVFDLKWMTIVIAYGFVARLASGPTLSPLGQIATRVVAPRLPSRKKLVAGPPKRFAQGIGATLSVTAAILAVGLGLTTAAYVLLGLLFAAAFLESVFALCLGCKIFALLMRIGIVPEEVCEECNNIWLRLPQPTQN